MDTAIFAMNEDAVAADITSHMGGEEACYDFGDGGCLSRGTIMTKPALFGIHPCHGGVMVIFGGYGGSFEIGDWAVKGTLICRAPDMTPSPPFGPCQLSYRPDPRRGSGHRRNTLRTRQHSCRSLRRALHRERPTLKIQVDNPHQP